jgi:hypothetical protein
MPDRRENIKDEMFNALLGWVESAYVEGYGTAKRNDLKERSIDEARMAFDVSHSKRAAESSMRFFVRNIVDSILDVLR